MEHKDSSSIVALDQEIATSADTSVQAPLPRLPES